MADAATPRARPDEDRSLPVVLRYPATAGQILPPWKRPLTRLVALLVATYRRWLSPLLPPACRFHPSCSQYALLTLATHRLPRAVGLIVWRLLRCQPLCSGGVEFPPPGPYGHGEALFEASWQPATSGSEGSTSPDGPCGHPPDRAHPHSRQLRK